MSGWLKVVEGDETKAYCSYCEVKLRAHYKDLERHCQTEKHRRQHSAAVQKEANTAASTGTLYST